RNKKTPPCGPTRLLQILISESAHLTWILRCESVIQGLQHGRALIATRWRNAINRRLTTDKLMTTK
ncbi:hypothetical protein F5148DRAFT_954742, partial [Russula earlei]